MLLERSKWVCTYLFTQISMWGSALFTLKNFGRPNIQCSLDIAICFHQEGWGRCTQRGRHVFPMNIYVKKVKNSAHKPINLRMYYIATSKTYGCRYFTTLERGHYSQGRCLRTDGGASRWLRSLYRQRGHDMYSRLIYISNGNYNQEIWFLKGS